MVTSSLSCCELIDFIDAYEGGELHADARAAFHAHLAECPDCVAYLAGYRKSVALGKRAFDATEEPVPEDVPDDLIRAVLAAKRRQRPG